MVYQLHSGIIFCRFNQIKLDIIPIFSKKTNWIGQFIGNSEVGKHLKKLNGVMFPFMSFFM